MRAAEVKVDWDAWAAHSLADGVSSRLAIVLGPSPVGPEPMRRDGRPDNGSLFDGTGVRTRIDKHAINASVLAAIGARGDGKTGAAIHTKQGRRKLAFALAAPHGSFERWMGRRIRLRPL